MIDTIMQEAMRDPLKATILLSLAIVGAVVIVEGFIAYVRGRQELIRRRRAIANSTLFDLTKRRRG